MAPNEAHLGRLPRLPLTVIERQGVSGHQGFQHDQLVFCDLARERQQLAYRLVREHQIIASSRVARANKDLSIVFHKKSLLSVGCWTWVYNSAMTAQQSRDKDDEHGLKSKLSLNSTGSFNILRAGPCDSAPDGKPVGDKLLYHKSQAQGLLKRILANVTTPFSRSWISSA